MAPSLRSSCVEAAARIAPSVGPMQGVQANAKAAPAMSGPPVPAREISASGRHSRLSLGTNGVTRHTTAAFGTTILAVAGIRRPGLEFRNQRVEAAYRKELVLGEDHADRAQPPTVRELFDNVRKNYFRLYFHYMYFNVARYFYLQTDNIFPYIILAPTIVAGKITLGAMNQILNAFEQVKSSMQYLVNSWSTIVELISIYKRLRLFESAIEGPAESEIKADEAYGAQQA